MSVVLVCGPRDYDALEPVWAILDALEPRPTRVVTGAARGVDGLADAWAARHGLARGLYPADWQAHGHAAGPIRNAGMLSAERPDLVLAIKREGQESPGTNDLVRRARRAGFPVRVFRVGPAGAWREEGGGEPVSIEEREEPRED